MSKKEQSVAPQEQGKNSEATPEKEQVAAKTQENSVAEDKAAEASVAAQAPEEKSVETPAPADAEAKSAADPLKAEKAAAAVVTAGVRRVKTDKATEATAAVAAPAPKVAEAQKAAAKPKAKKKKKKKRKRRSWLFRVLMWLALVVVFLLGFLAVALVTLYNSVSESDLPTAEVQFEDTVINYSGYDWEIPITGPLKREFNYDNGGTVQQLGTVNGFDLSVTSSPNCTPNITIVNSADETVFDGTLSDYNNFNYGQNGEYTATVQLARTQDDNADSYGNTVTGSYRYQFAFNLEAIPVVTATAQAMEGGVVAVRIQNSLGNLPPTVDTEFTTASFVKNGREWVAYLGVDIDTLVKDYPIIVNCDGYTTELSVHITYRERQELQVSRAVVPLMTKTPPEVVALLDIADPEIYWNGQFTRPVQGQSKRNYCVDEVITREVSGTSRPIEEWTIDPITLVPTPPASYTSKSSRGISNNVTLYTSDNVELLCPASGRVVFAGETSGGNTIVIEHGCGLKSVLYQVGTVGVTEGDYVSQGDVIGYNQGYLICAAFLGTSCIDPWPLWGGYGALFGE